MPLHPQAKAFLEAAAKSNAPSWDQMKPVDARNAFVALKDLFGVGPELHNVENRTLAGQLGIRIYRPSPKRPLPAIMFFHGGGWELGDLDSHDTLCRRLAQGSGCALIAVNYLRSPEYRFPSAFGDCYAVTQYVAKHAMDFGVDADRIAVCGDSAGGNLAAAVALHARDEGDLPIHSQWLIYPVMEANFETGSYRAFGEGYGLTQATMKWFWDQYVPSTEGRLNPLAAPGRAHSLAGLPAAHMITAEFDPLRDEGESYARRLKAAGVPVTARCYDGMIHGFLHFTEPFDDGKRAVAELAQEMKRALNP